MKTLYRLQGTQQAYSKRKLHISLINELLEELVGVIIFSKTNSRAGYYHKRVSHRDIYNIVSRTYNDHYEFLIMPFDLTKPLTIFQSLMNEVFCVRLIKFILVFFDDIIIYSHTFIDYLRHLQIVFELLISHQLVTKNSKYVFCNDTM